LTLVLDWENLDGEGYDYCAQYGCDDHDKPLWLEYPIAYWGVYVEMFIFISQFIFAMRFCYALGDETDYVWSKYVDINYKVDYTAMNLKRISAVARAGTKGGSVVAQVIHAAHEDRKAERKTLHDATQGAKDKKAKEAHDRLKKLHASRDKGAATKNPDGYVEPNLKKKKEGSNNAVSPGGVQLQPVPLQEIDKANGDTGPTADEEKASKTESMIESMGNESGESLDEAGV